VTILPSCDKKKKKSNTVVLKTTFSCISPLQKVRERLAANKHRSHRFHMERLNLKKLIEVKGKGMYHIEVSNRFAA
jgi:hypothetical protein